MNTRMQTQVQTTPTPSFTPMPGRQLQRKCACGMHTMGGGQCADCARGKSGLQRKLAIGASHDPLEREADRVADQVMAATANPTVNSTPPRIQRLTGHATGENGTAPASVDRVLASGGRPLEPALQQDMGQRFGHDFSQVRVHSSVAAEQSAKDVNAHAYTVGTNIVFGAGRFAPGTHEGRRLLAHELTHVVQQTGGGRSEKAQQQRALANGKESPDVVIGQTPAVPTIQRDVEVRPPGRGEASAFDRRQELIDRLNTLSAAIQYRLEGRRIVFDVIDEPALTNFDRQMRGFIGRAEVVPLRLITSAGRVQGDGGGFVPLLIDSFVAGYLDLDDMLASDDLSFQMNLIHMLAERFRVRNYERRIGTNISQAEFDRAHQAGIEVEAELLRNVIGDPTIRFNFEETKPNGTLVFAFRSREGYRVFHVFRRDGQERRGGEIFVRTSDGRRLTINQLIAERAAAAPVAP